MNIKLSNLLQDVVIKNHPDWNVIQVDVFKQLQERGYKLSDIVKHMKVIGKEFRDYMNSNYDSTGWEIDDSVEDVKQHLLNIAISNLDNIKNDNIV